MNKPLVSIIIATYNRGQYIQKALNSIYDQTYSNKEVIVVDDNSRDNTQEVLSQYQHSQNFKVIKPEKKAGRIVARDIGIEQSSGTYIAILDSDDWWSDSTKLEQQIEFLEKNPEYVLVGGGLVKVDGSGKEILRFLPPKHDEVIRHRLLFNNMMSHSTVVFRKSVFEKVGWYCKKEGSWLESAEDWNLYLKMGTEGKLYNFQKYFTYYLEAGQNVSFERVQRDLLFNQKIRVKYRKDYLGFPIAYVLGWFYCIYYLIPGRNKFSAVLRRIRKIILKY